MSIRMVSIFDVSTGGGKLYYLWYYLSSPIFDDIANITYGLVTRPFPWS